MEQETVVESTTSDPAVEAVEADGAETEAIPDSFVENFNLDDLLAADFGDDEIMSKEHRGLPQYNEVLASMTKNGRKLVANMRSLTTKRTQEVAELRRSLEAERAQLARERELLYNGDFATKMAQMAQDPEVPRDLYSDDGMRQQIQQEAAKSFQEMLAPMQQRIQVAERQAAYERFIQANPLIKDPEVAGEIEQILTSRGEGFSLEDAFTIASSKILLKRNQAAKEHARVETNSRRDTYRRTSGGTTSGARASAPAGMSAREKYDWHLSNSSK